MLPVAAAVLAGCGGDTRLSREAYVARADAICTAGQERLRAIPRPRNLFDGAELQRYAREAADVLQREVDELRELKPPEEGEATVERMLASVQGAIDTARELQESRQVTAYAARRGELEQKLAAAREAARSYGLTACAEQSL